MTRRPRPPARSAPRRSRQSALWRDRRFCVFLTSQTLSVAGDSFALIAVPLLILRATGSVAQMGLLTGAAGAAAVVAGIFAGILVDRLDRWILMAACDLARMLLYGLIPLVWSVHPQVWLLYVILPLCAALGMVFQVGYVTVVPALSGPARITEANGLLYGASSTAAIAGPLLAGLVSAALGPAGAIAVDAVSFAASAVGVLLVRRSLSVARTEAPHPAVSGGRVADGCSAMPSATGTPDTAGEPDRDATGSPGPLANLAGRGLAGVAGWGPVPVAAACAARVDRAADVLHLRDRGAAGRPDLLHQARSRAGGRRGWGWCSPSLRSAPSSAPWPWLHCAAGLGLARAGSGPSCCAGWRSAAWARQEASRPPPPWPPSTWGVPAWRGSAPCRCASRSLRIICWAG